jgi:hypothetical protein
MARKSSQSLLAISTKGPLGSHMSRKTHKREGVVADAPGTPEVVKHDRASLKRQRSAEAASKPLEVSPNGVDDALPAATGRSSASVSPARSQDGVKGAPKSPSLQAYGSHSGSGASYTDSENDHSGVLTLCSVHPG